MGGYGFCKGKGWILEYIHRIEKAEHLSGQQRFSVDFTATARVLGYKREWALEWELQTGGEEIKEGDIICLLQGGSMPSITKEGSDNNREHSAAKSL
ncbi:HET-domain-containing protein [Penicillium malachiteum]|uniref:HET-domain-containing protein n=1 Tax=Penicillium malachiteum TaxID=1324776 RepID=A0AAD6N1N3_9EURO|nr:HET-domain-containing protein [Penicillium malachiteum]